METTTQEAPVGATELPWGFKGSLLKGAALWGARTIWPGHGRPDVLWDRQGAIGSAAAAGELMKLLNGTGRKTGALESFLAAVKAGKVSPAADEVTEPWTTKGVTFQARAAGGYLYVTAAKAVTP